MRYEATTHYSKDNKVVQLKQLISRIASMAATPLWLLILIEMYLLMAH